jgi:hypothetical protein
MTASFTEEEDAALDAAEDHLLEFNERVDPEGRLDLDWDLLRWFHDQDCTECPGGRSPTPTIDKED